ncbi:MAG: tyrosine--tRNA ligase [Candidatus Moranbacteria bacterium]|nr:tyrosine--tRNA ligase [Candidatus Moranbacteria bacterium]
MATILKDQKLIDEFLNRGVEKIYPSKEKLRKKLLSGKKLKIYQGFDPTGKYLHVGHAIGIRALSILQKLGHEVIFLVGDFTSKIGDPDKDTTREMLNDQQIYSNMRGWQKQAAQLIEFEGKNPVKFLYNSSWLSKLQFEDILKLMSKITLQRMIERDMFERRLKQGDPIRLHEMIYPLMQGYDGVAMEVDMELGGSDQTFNMLVGRDISRAYLNKEKFVRTHQMMDAPDQRTMSKTKGNGINLSDSAEEIFGKAMSYPDSLIIKGFELLTKVEMKDIKRYEKLIKQGQNPMKFKKIMAFEIVKLIKGEKKAKKAKEHFVKVFSKRETPDEIKTYKLSSLLKESQQQLNLLDLLNSLKIRDSKGKCKQLIAQGGVSIDGKKQTDLNLSITEILDKKPQIIIKAGKKDFLKIIKA